MDLTEVGFEGDGFPMIGEEEELKRFLTSVLTVEKIEAVAMAVCDLGSIDKSWFLFCLIQVFPSGLVLLTKNLASSVFHRFRLRQMNFMLLSLFKNGTMCHLHGRT